MSDKACLADGVIPYEKKEEQKTSLDVELIKNSQTVTYQLVRQ